VHQISIEHAKHALMGDDKQVVLLAFELENNGLEANGQIVVGLKLC